MDDAEARRRWRLILGEQAQNEARSEWSELDHQSQAIDETLAFLFDREHDKDEGTYRDRAGGTGSSKLTVPRWLGQIRKLFPSSTAQSLTRLALERYQLHEILTDQATLESVEPNIDLLRAILSVKEIVPDALLDQVRRIVARVVAELTRKLASDVRRHFTGAMRHRSPGSWKVSKNFDVATTLRKNLRNYQPITQKLIVDKPYFFSRLKRQHPWDIVLLVDQSGSMIDSMIYSAVLAGIFRGLPMLRTHLVLFDTQVVDLSDRAEDPVEILMRAQLGGGTDIAQALRYAQSLVVHPRRTIVAVVTDFYEGGEIADLLSATADLMSDGVLLLGLASLDDRSEPTHDHHTARRLADLGMHVAAMTPDRLAEWVAERIRT